MANGERPPVPATYYTRTEPSEVRLMKAWLNGPWPMHRILARLHLNHGIIIINFFFFFGAVPDITCVHDSQINMCHNEIGWLADTFGRRERLRTGTYTEQH